VIVNGSARLGRVGSAVAHHGVVHARDGHSEAAITNLVFNTAMAFYSGVSQLETNFAIQPVDPSVYSVEP
jgi:hypothetical protein